jgi:cytochrome P450
MRWVPLMSGPGFPRYAADKDPWRFPDPDELRFDRSDDSPPGFGHGSQFCLGAPPARGELQEGRPAGVRAQAGG